MKLNAVETTDRMQLCQINARNIRVFRDRYKAHDYAIKTALAHRDKARERINIIFDVNLDGVIKVYDKAEGDAENAPALAYLSTIETSD